MKNNLKIMNYDEILKKAELSAIQIKESIQNESDDLFYADVMSWYDDLSRQKKEWKLYGDILLDIASKESCIDNFNEFKIELDKLIKLSDRDGKEKLQAFIKMIELGKYNNVKFNTGDKISEFFMIFRKSLGA